jgi:DNA (cytosine-5)-methyltransferase 1
MRKIKIGSDFSGVGAFDYAIQRVANKKGFTTESIYACDWDKYARITYAHNHGEPSYYPKDVYDREIPKDSLDIYMTSPPCQAFSLAGKRLGKDDKRGILFFNSHEFIQENKPRFFIFENVKGLLSDDGGKTFQEWINMLGGKSVNGVPILFPYEDSVPYHLYWKVLNAKHHGIPQNRERLFIIGIREDSDNNFQFPREEHLTKRLKDVLEGNVDDKYFLSDKMLNCLFEHKSDKFQINTPVINETDEARTLRTEMAKMGRQDNFIKIDLKKVGYINQDTQASAVYDENGVAQTMTSGTHGYAMGYVQVSDENPKIGAFRGRNPKNPSDRTTGSPTQQRLEINENGTSNAITTVQKDNVVIQLNESKEVDQTLDTQCNQGVIIPLFHWGKGKNNERMVYDKEGISPCMTSAMGMGGGYTPSVIKDYKIRRLTPREAFRLMDFPETFDFSCVSDSQAYKQAGNSIVVRVLEKILEKLPL